MGEQVYLSPHLDDALYSCGGWIARQASAGARVTVLTICAGDPPTGPLSDFTRELHDRWGESVPPMQARREEDRRACEALGARAVHLGVPDAVYRVDHRGQLLYPTEPAAFGVLHLDERRLVRETADQIGDTAPPEAEIYCPVGFGGHVDHRLTRRAAERLGRPLRYYPDFPYAARGLEIAPEQGSPPGRRVSVRLDAEELEGWVRAIVAYRTQFSTFWSEVDELRRELRAYHNRHGGLVFWIPGEDFASNERVDSRKPE
jgi:LmbE family N-acetylglucosaminyl deacetylase